MFCRSLRRAALQPKIVNGQKLSQRSMCVTSEMDRDERLQFLNSPPYVLPGHKKITCQPMVYISGMASQLRKNKNK